MEKHQHNIESLKSDKMLWLASQIFTAFPDEVTGLKFYVLGCGCIYYQRVFPDGATDSKTGIYRAAKNGPCEICMQQDGAWKERSLDEIIIYDSKFEVVEN